MFHPDWSPAFQRRIIAVSALVVFSMGMIARLNRGEDQFSVDSARFYVGVGFTFTFISVLADLGQPIGAAFALLIMITSFLYNGESVFGFLLQRAKGPVKVPKNPNTTGGNNSGSNR